MTAKTTFQSFIGLLFMLIKVNVSGVNGVFIAFICPNVRRSITDPGELIRSQIVNSGFVYGMENTRPI